MQKMKKIGKFGAEIKKCADNFRHDSIKIKNENHDRNEITSYLHDACMQVI